MAIAFGRAKIIGRGSGQSLTGCAAYRFGVRLRDELYGKTQDYSQRQGVVATGIALPKDAPEWMNDLEKLTNAIERREERSTRPDTAQLAREYIIALPHELSDQQREWLVRNIAKEGATREGMIAMWAIHEPGKEGDQRNYHAHVMLTMREIDATDRDGFGGKNREWNSKAADAQFKGVIERESNRMLERAGVEERVSFAWEEGHIGQRHLGHGASALERQGIETEIGNENRDIAAHNRHLAAISQQRAALELEIAALQQSPEIAITAAGQEVTALEREQHQPEPVTARQTEREIEPSPIIEALPEIAAKADRVIDKAGDAVEQVGDFITGGIQGVFLGVEEFFFGGASRRAPGGAESEIPMTNQREPNPSARRSQEARDYLGRQDPTMINEPQVKTVRDMFPGHVQPDMQDRIRRWMEEQQRRREEQERER